VKRLYAAICSLIEAKAADLVKPDKPAEHHPEGNNFSATERKGVSLEPYELHSQWRPDSYGVISLKWRPEQ
jgi:hypothetical protein